MRGKPYDEQQLASLIRLWQKGLLVQDIAQELGRSEGSVYHKLYAMGLHRYNIWPGEKLAKLETCSELGWSTKRTAKSLGCTETSVKRARSEYGIDVMEGWYTARRLASMLGVSRHIVRGWIKHGYINTQWIRRHVCQAASYEDVIAFLDDSTYWPLWNASDITDPFLREHAHSIKKIKYLTVLDVAKALLVSRRIAQQYMASSNMRKVLLKAGYHVRVDWFREWLTLHREIRLYNSEVLT